MTNEELLRRAATNDQLIESAVTDICNDARLSSKGQHGDYYRCIISQAIARATATLEAENARLKKSANAWDALYSMLQAVLEPEVTETDDEPGDAKLNAYIDVYRRLKSEHARLAALVERLAKWLPDPKTMSGYDDPDAPEEVKRNFAELANLLAAIGEPNTTAGSDG